MTMQTARAWGRNDIWAERAEKRTVFLAAHGWADATTTTLFDQASFRKYYRATKASGETVVLMDSPFREEKLAEFVEIDKILLACGVRAPQIYALDMAEGFALLEDFGDRVYANLFDAGEDKKALTARGIDVLVHLHKTYKPEAHAHQLPDETVWNFYENNFFCDWYWPARFGHETPPDIRAEFELILKNLYYSLPPLFKTMVLPDYHSPNLLDLVGVDGVQGVGVIDFQDAVLGSPIYSVMAMLEDDRRDLSDDIIESMKARYLEAMGGLVDPEAFDVHFAYFSAQRHAKNMGNFVQIVVRRDLAEFLDYLPQATKWFDRAIQHPYMLPLKNFMAKHCPDYNTPLTEIRKWQ